ncbi:hypothetical protein AB0P21_20790 [Kribbella sp. NPDC056861]|uniref:hypothetical protein n=1 Tax=Kribbella sp. NPDC056861 TaxID=3154857 RepID=UPI0034138129
MVKRLERPESNEDLTPDQKRRRYQYSVAVSLNILDQPLLRTMHLEQRREWLEKHPDRTLQTRASRARAEWPLAIKQMAEIILQQYIAANPGELETAVAGLVQSPALPDLRGIDQERAEALAASGGAEQNQEQVRGSVEGPPSWRKRRVLYPVVALAIAAVTATGVNIIGGDHDSGDPSSASTKGTISPSNCQSGFCVAREWPRIRGCDGGTQVAMSPGGRDFTSFPAETEDIRPAVANADGGGSWRRGHLYMVMSSVDGEPVTIMNMVQHRDPTRLPAPAWVYKPTGDCGDTYSRVYQLDLDEDSLIDLGLNGNPQGKDGDEAVVAEPLGPAFTVTDQHPALIRVDALSCKDNYSWTLDITFVRDGVTGTRIIGPYRSMGKAENTELHQDDPYTGKLSGGVTRFTSKPTDKC